MCRQRSVFSSRRAFLFFACILSSMFLSRTLSFRPWGLLSPLRMVYTANSSPRRMLSSEAETFPPPRRQFQPLPDLVEQNTREKIITHDRLRILQFNVLADGLSGLRPDLGAFSRVQKEFMLWEMRRDRLLEEILQYDPDVVTLQECDHYHDFFLPELLMRGYSGYFAPKPASACLEVADRSDGCAIFYKRDVLRVISSQTLTYSLSKADVLSDEQQQHGHVMQIEDKQPRPQNQVALILLCEFLKNRLQTDPKSNKRVKPPVILATTHLKASKNAEGERYRHLETVQLLKAIETMQSSFAQNRTYKSPAVIFTGDLNASPATTSSAFGFNCTVYNLIKQHPSSYRSVLNDDLLEFRRETDPTYTEEEIWTTWKARRKLTKGKETVVRHCIDYIMYAPLQKDTVAASASCMAESCEQVGVRATAVLDGFRDIEVDQALFPNALYPSDHIAIAADLQIVERVVDDSGLL